MAGPGVDKENTVIRSMTAFARYEESSEAGSIVWELRSVNHRYLEPAIRLPEDFRQLEPEIRKLLGNYLARGKVDLGLRYKLDDQRQAAAGAAAAAARQAAAQDIVDLTNEKANVEDEKSFYYMAALL